MLDWNVISIPFVGGLDTKSSEASVLPTKLVVLENGEFTKYGSVRKRPGYTAVPARTTTGAALTGTPMAVFSRDDELVLVTDQKIYSWDPTLAGYVDRGPYWNATHTLEELAYQQSEQSNADMASTGTIAAVAWEDSRTANTVRYRVWNEVTGAVYTHDTLISNAERPYVVAVGTNLLICWASTNTDNIKAIVVRQASALTDSTGSAIDIVTDLNATGRYCAIAEGEFAYFFYTSDGSVTAGMRLVRTNSVGTVLQAAEVVADVGNLIGIASDGTRLGLAWKDTATDDIKVQPWNASNLTSAGAAGTLVSALTTATRVAIAPRNAGTNDWVLWVENDAGADWNASVSSYYYSTGSPSYATIFHSFIASSGFVTGTTDRPKVILGFESESGLQHGYSVYDSDGNLVGGMLQRQGIALPAKDHPPYVRSGTVALGFKRQLDAAADNIAVYTHQGIQRCSFDFAAPPTAVQVGSTLYLSGSQLWAYDGVTAVESGFTRWPDVQAGSFTANDDAAKLLLTTVSYSYRFYYEWYTSAGERMRSLALSVTYAPTFASGTGTITVAVPTLSATQKHELTGSPRTRVAIVGYRTEGNTTTNLYYRVTGLDPAVTTGDNAYLHNSVAANTVSLVDNYNTATLITKEIDYLSAGELRQSAPAGPAVVVTGQDRLFIAGGAVRRNNLLYSKEHFDGLPVEFSDVLEVENGPEHGGPITGLGVLNDTPVVFKRNGIFALVGTGPDNTGGSGVYDTQEITSDVGCLDHRSIVRVPMGLMFQSAKGIYLLNSSFALQYIGADVEAYNSQTVVGAHTVPDTTQVVFVCSEGTALVYDYQFNSWSTWTNHAALGSTIWGGTRYAYLRTDGEVHVRDTSVYSDAGNGYALKLRTGPLRLTDVLQQFSKMTKVMFLGHYGSPHRLKVGLYYNREDAPYEEFTWDPLDVIDDSTWGSDDTWGDGAVWGGTADARTYQFEHRPKRTKFATIRFEFTELPGNPPGAGFEMTELALKVGSSPNLQQQSATRKY